MAVKPNPDPARITAAMWRLWTEFHAHRPATELGGIWVRKPGYHGTRADQAAGDYSIAYRIDRQGPSDKAAAIDLTFDDAQRGNFAEIIRYTKRLDAAARARDPRLYVAGVRVLREFIGTLNGRVPYAYDLERGESDNDRDDSHLWHIHLSVTRQFVADWDVLSGVLSVLVDGDIEGDDDVIGLKKGDSGERVKGLQACLTRAGFPVEVDGDYGEKTAAAVLAMRKSDGSTVTNGDNITGWAYGQLMAVLARKQGTGERGPAGPAGPQGPPGTPAKLPAKLVITGTVTAG